MERVVILVALALGLSREAVGVSNSAAENLTNIPGNEPTCSANYSDIAQEQIQSIYSSVMKENCKLANPHNYPPQYNPKNGEEFDFIVVGAGSAGSVVANRLAEVSGWKVLLLEAGGNPTKSSEVPALFSFLQETEIDWQYQTKPSEENCLGMESKRCKWPRGKVLGGSSTINYMLYIRGNSKDYDGWAADGNTGWGYENVLPYFKKSEDMRAEEVLKTSDFEKYHGTGGYLKVESFAKEDVMELGRALAKGFDELGYQSNPDCNGKTQTGFVTVQGTLEDGRRCSTAKAFLTPIIGRDNLMVSKQSLVSKVLIDRKKKLAYGVEFINNHGKTVSVRAKNEVILSAGAINTPQLLMLSGIGPKEHLEKLNIEVIEDLPVGKNLQDHLLMIGLVVSVDYFKPSDSPEVNMFDFLLKRDSRYSGIGLTTYAGFVNTIKDVDYPDIELLFVDIPKNDTAALSKLLTLFGVQDEIKSKYLEINSKSYTILVFGSLLRPFSRGNIELKNNKPKDHPQITSGYFSDSRDIDTFLRTYEFVSQLIETEGMKSVNATLNEIQVPACNKFEFASRDYRECSLRHLTVSTYHPCCTANMGPMDSTDSVVDPTLRVKGVNGLRVIDASVMPTETSGNINAPVIMIGEKGSDLIKETWLKT